MRFIKNILIGFLVVGGPANPAAAQSWENFTIPSDPKAQYTMMVLVRQPPAVGFLSKRWSAKGGYSFSFIEMNCSEGTYRYMGYGDTLEEAKASITDTDPMALITDQSIKYYQFLKVCR